VAVEEPKFDLVLKDGAFEVRDYGPLLVAEVTVTGDQQQAGRKGFGLLAKYIFGGNTQQRKIAMTAPVTKIAHGQTITMTAPVTQIKSEASWQVRFAMPGNLAQADLPEPNNHAVTIIALPPRRTAVLGFSGLAGETKVAAIAYELRNIIEARGMRPVGLAVIALYNPPWTPWFLRRNEVMFDVAGEMSERP
jgi:hypothetical protein